MNVNGEEDDIYIAQKGSVEWEDQLQVDTWDKDSKGNQDNSYNVDDLFETNIGVHVDFEHLEESDHRN